VTAYRRPALRCTWRECTQPAAATVAFVLPNLPAGSRRDYCAAPIMTVSMARGAVVVVRFGPHQPALPGLPRRRRQADPTGHQEQEGGGALTCGRDGPF
jgi:hypothetical protein